MGKVMTFLTDNAVAVEADTAAADTLAEKLTGFLRNNKETKMPGIF